MNCNNDIFKVQLNLFVVNYFNFSLDVYHVDNNTTTGTSALNTDNDLCANNNNYQLIILPVVFCFSLILFILSVILFTMTFVMIKNRNIR